VETRIVPVISTGDVVVISLLKPIRYSLSKRGGERFRQLRLRRRRTKKWLVALDRIGVVRSRFWEMKLLWGRVGWVRRTGGLIRLGLYAKCRKQLVYAVVFLGVCNIALLSVLHLVVGRGRVGRKVLSFIPKLRSKKLKRMFPLRRMNRKFKKVK